LLRLFRLNDPYRIILIFIILISVRIIWVLIGMPLSIPLMKWLALGERLGNGFTMYSECFDYTAPLSSLVYQSIDYVFGATRWTHVVFSSLLITIQAGIFNSTLLRNKAYQENTFIPAFLYMVLCCGVTDFWTLSPELMSTTFLLLAINQIFRRIDNVVTDELFLYSGIYVGIATFFFPPSAVFFLVFLVSFIGFSSAVARRILLYVYGFTVVFVGSLGYFFWFDASEAFLDTLFDVFRPKIFYLSYPQFFVASGAIALALLFSIVPLFNIRFTNFQQKTIQVMLLFFVGAAGCVLLSNNLSSTTLILFVPTVAFLLTHYFLNIKKTWVKLVVPNFIIISLLVYPYIFLHFAEENQLTLNSSAANYQDKKVMMIGSDLSVYQENYMSSPFIDERISMSRLEGLDYYEKATELFLVLKGSDPEVIIDQYNVMAKINERFPYFRENYRRNSFGDYVKISN
jgi:hypothetical protein